MKHHWSVYRKNRLFNFALIFLAFLGDLGGSTEHDEVGGDKDSIHRDGLPNSPTSSGGFRRFSSKGLCRKELSAQHCFGGNMELYVQDLLCCLPPRNCFQTVGWLWSWEHSSQIRSGPANVKLWMSPNRCALVGSIEAFWRFRQKFCSIGSYVSGFICFLPHWQFYPMCNRWLGRIGS